jgi:hypothetical protein
VPVHAAGREIFDYFQLVERLDNYRHEILPATYSAQYLRNDRRECTGERCHPFD